MFRQLRIRIGVEGFGRGAVDRERRGHATPFGQIRDPAREAFIVAAEGALDERLLVAEALQQRGWGKADLGGDVG
jgi:hypothetical protein